MINFIILLILYRLTLKLNQYLQNKIYGLENIEGILLHYGATQESTELLLKG